MADVILLLQADHDIQTAFDRNEAQQPGRGERFLRQLEDVALTLLRYHPQRACVYALCSTLMGLKPGLHLPDCLIL
jgi:hypothetical protein